MDVVDRPLDVRPSAAAQCRRLLVGRDAAARPDGLRVRHQDALRYFLVARFAVLQRGAGLAALGDPMCSRRYEPAAVRVRRQLVAHLAVRYCRCL